MMASSNPKVYSKTAIALHWLVALLIVINFSFGLWLVASEGTPTWSQILFYHGSIGSLIFLLVIYRYYWRITHKPPVLPISMPVWERSIAHLVHGLLYVLMLIIPLTGYLYRAAGSHPVEVFGLFSWPMIVEKNLPLRIAMLNWHKSLVWVLAFLVAGHIAAALKHQWLNRDDILARMMPSLKRRS